MLKNYCIQVSVWAVAASGEEGAYMATEQGGWGLLLILYTGRMHYSSGISVLISSDPVSPAGWAEQDLWPVLYSSRHWNLEVFRNPQHRWVRVLDQECTWFLRTEIPWTQPQVLSIMPLTPEPRASLPSFINSSSLKVPMRERWCPSRSIRANTRVRITIHLFYQSLTQKYPLFSPNQALQRAREAQLWPSSPSLLTESLPGNQLTLED